MGANTKIEWTDHTFNPWIGCTKVSPGCAICYAEGESKRRGWAQWGKGKDRHRTSAAYWKQPLIWNNAWEHALGPNFGRRKDRRKTRVFCASLADWLDDEVPIEWLADLLALIHATQNLDWQLLTKRPENWSDRLHEAFRADTTGGSLDYLSPWLDGDPPPNVWIGVSVEDQKRADERRELLQNIPAVIRFISYEPALKIVDWGGWEWLDWLIAGGESSPGHSLRTNRARPVHPDAFRVARDFSELNGIAFFFKQWGNWIEHSKPPIRGTNNGAGVYILRDSTFGQQGDYWDGRAAGMDLVGKKAAGRLLDGREHNGFPTKLEAIAT